jgi:hypothetical protein
VFDGLRIAQRTLAQRLAETCGGENKREWFRQAERDFQRDRAGYEQLLTSLIETRELLAQEAQLLSFLINGQESAVRMAHGLFVSVSGVEGLAKEVPAADVLQALRDELLELEAAALIEAQGVHSG